MVVVAIGSEDFLYQAQYETPNYPLMSFKRDDTPMFTQNATDGLLFLLRLCETYRTSAWYKNHKKVLTRDNLRFVVPPEIKEASGVPDEIVGIPVLVNKAIPVSRRTTFFTNRPRYSEPDFPESEIFEQWDEKAMTSIYLFDCDNFDIYEIHSIEL